MLRPVLSSIRVPCNDQGGAVCSCAWLQTTVCPNTPEGVWRQRDYFTAPNRVKCCKADEKKQRGKRQELDVMYLCLLQRRRGLLPPLFHTRTATTDGVYIWCSTEVTFDQYL